MPIIANGLGLYYFHIFKSAFDKLKAAVTLLAQDDPREYKTRPKTKLLASAIAQFPDELTGETTQWQPRR